MTPIDQFLTALAAKRRRPSRPVPLADADFAAAERALGHPLPPSYRRLLTGCHWNDLPHVIYWLGRHLPPGVDLLHMNRVVAVPPFLIAVSGDGGGDEFCFDTRHPGPDGEYPIVRWEHEIHDEQSTTFERVDDDLGAFLLPLI